MKIDVKECANLLLRQDNILILTHAHPDGDTLGSGFALCRALMQLGKKARVINDDVIPKNMIIFIPILIFRNLRRIMLLPLMLPPKICSAACKAAMPAR